MGATVAPPEPYQFPSTWRASFLTWWNSGEGKQCEDNLLTRGLGPIPLRRFSESGEVQPVLSNMLPATADDRTATIRHVELSGDKSRFLNVLEIGRGERSANDHNLVMLHGYGGALGFAFQNIQSMSSVHGTRFFALDWLGMGRSGGHFPRIRPKGKGAAAVRSRVNQAEDFFIDSLEEWRAQESLPKLTLMGHSLGGYFAAAYALKYPDRVNKLILISPAGVPEAPYELPSATDAEIVENVAAAELGSQMDSATSNTRAKDKPPSGLLPKLWEANIFSPFSLVRMSSFMGPKLVSRYAAWRYSSFPNDVQKDLFDYLYLISRQKGAGEFALPHILTPGVYARWPLIQRLKSTNLPITLIYGDHDWMQPKHGYALVDMLKNKPKTPETELQKKRSRVHINDHAGHWVFLENPAGFNRIIEKEIRQAVQDHPSP